MITFSFKYRTKRNYHNRNEIQFSNDSIILVKDINNENYFKEGNVILFTIT